MINNFLSMKTTIMILCFALLSCGTTKTIQTATVDKDGYLVGITQKSDFQKPPFAEWFNENYEDYPLDMGVVNQIKPLLKGVKIKAVIGTWCGDSRRETPVFYKLLDEVGFDYKNLEMITVNRDKTSPNNEEKDLGIERVPTFIFYKNNVEFNRFVEYPRETLEEDFLKILQETGYKHSYLE
jgi:thiol-disulfide isomerase/thioredoxin